MSFPTSTSASFGTTRLEGGMAKDLRSVVSDLESSTVTQKILTEIDYVFEGFRVCILTPNDRATVENGGVVQGKVLFPTALVESDTRRGFLLGFAAMALRVHHRLERKDLPLCRQSAVKEKGCKVRGVTPLDSSVSYISQFLNSGLISLLNRDPRLETLSASPAESFLKVCHIAYPEVVRSVDMTRATDLIPHQVAQSLAKGLIKGLALPKFLSEAFMLLTGPHLLFTLSGERLCTQGGILMGSGTTWPLLSLYNLWLWEESHHRCGLDYPLRRRSSKRVRIVGDDLIGVSTRLVSETYTSLLEETGGGTSFGKDYTTGRYGCLVEELIDTQNLEVVPTISVAGMQPETRVDKGSLLQPWAMGPRLSAYCCSLGSPSWLVEHIRFRYKGALRLLKRHSIPRYLPREFGGAGFPTNGSLKDILSSLRPQWARALRVCISQGQEAEAYLARFLSAWSSSSSLVSFHDAKFLQGCQLDAVESRGYPKPGEGEGLPTLGQLLERVAAVLTAAKALWEPTIRYFPLTLPLLKKRLNRSISEINRLVPRGRLEGPMKDLHAGLEKVLERLRSPVFRNSGIDILSDMSLRSTGMTDGPQMPADYLEFVILDEFDLLAFD